MKIICLSCGHKVELGDAYDDYAGPVKCVACRAVLEIETGTGNLRSLALRREVAHDVAAAAADAPNA